MKNIENYNLKELRSEECLDINGGIIGAYLVASLAGAYYLGYAVGYLSR
ncbi:class IIb bacteriocin, lactobin A/cerein 7B family [Flavivirga jejuensis]|uniref:Class IIb bacteriocin, lactobin A/cerein 7B family n=1 Tax=Flavivirga jejuensis TaxID=870487 RepID=A0ABT8WVH3_9FLAO|nr:class IIb bacteriocin, lactobin A/cerein 7B family [Flavivirga jejuensis]MDO5977178.1 class IIb bacteriocin, lactobin A/cerein 7B family [Flavivirga jejuensis]